MPNKRSPEVQKKIDEFRAKINALPNVDLTDPEANAEIKARLGNAIWPEIEKIDSLQAKTAGRAFTKRVG